MIEYLIALLAGTLYGLIVGIIPAAGATTGLVALFPFIVMMQSVDPYLAVVFIMAVVAASTTGDTFASILLGIPGANSSAATMVDGFPLAQQGKASYALSAAITTSTVNGLLFGSLTFLLLPWYKDFLLLPATQGGVGQSELFAFCIMAFVTVSFVSNKYWIRSIIALSVGIFLSLVGTDPITAAPRFTMGWEFLEGAGGRGVPMIPLMAGIFAMPEMILALQKESIFSKHYRVDDRQQIIDGIKISFKEWKLSLRGGLIGSIVGFLPGIGGGVSDWLSYGGAVAANPKETFGKGNIKGVIGPEGSNNAQKATSMIPTVLFGIPGAPFAAVVVGLFGAIGFELTLDSASVLKDGKFFNAMSIGFLAATALTGIICLLTIKYISRITYVPYKYYFPVILSLIVWATFTSGFSTYGVENVALLVVFTLVGLVAKKYEFSRPALMIGFILGYKIEELAMQTFQLFNVAGYPLIKLKELFGYHVGQGKIDVALMPGKDLLTHPTFIGICLITVAVIYWGYKNKGRIDYA
jgi:putative tricarboxylic transport membrane protein